MRPGSRFFMEPLRSLAFGGIGAAYVPLGDPLEAPSRSFLVQNLTDAALVFSFGDGIDHFVLPPYGQFVYDASANKTHQTNNLLQNNLVLSVKQETAAPTIGNVYCSIFSGEGNSR